MIFSLKPEYCGKAPKSPGPRKSQACEKLTPLLGHSSTVHEHRFLNKELIFGTDDVGEYFYFQSILHHHFHRLTHLIDSTSIPTLLLLFVIVINISHDTKIKG